MCFDSFADMARPRAAAHPISGPLSARLSLISQDLRFGDRVGSLVRPIRDTTLFEFFRHSGRERVDLGKERKALICRPAPQFSVFPSSPTIGGR
jgi:hypothetical protein